MPKWTQTYLKLKSASLSKSKAKPSGQPAETSGGSWLSQEGPTQRTRKKSKPIRGTGGNRAKRRKGKNLSNESGPLVNVKGMAWVPKATSGTQAIQRLKDRLELTYTVNEGFPGEKLETLQLWEETDDHLLVPRAFAAETFPQDRLRYEGPQTISMDLSFDGSLDSGRDQPRACKDTLSALKGEFGGGILCAKTGAGKTVMGCYLAAALGLKTLIVVHNSKLREQWEEEVKKFLGITPGVIQQDRCETNKPVSIAMIQTLLSRDYGEKFGSLWGLTIWDECQHVGAPVFNTAVRKFLGPYRIGLSATPKRRDRLDKAFLWNIGPIVYESKTSAGILTPEVYQVQTKARIPYRLAQHSNFRRFRAKIVTLLAKDEARNARIAVDIVDAINAGRRVIAMSERTAQLGILLSFLKEAIKDGRIRKPDSEIIVLTAQTSDAARKRVGECDVLLTTYQMSREGINIPELDAQFLCTPTGSIEQVTGRVRRPDPDKKTPIIVDYVDTNIPALLHRGKTRYYQYRRLGYKVQTEALV